MNPMSSEEDLAKFQASILDYWRQYGRHDLPWRTTKDPWQIVIAEVLLRKTTSAQAIPIYIELRGFTPKEIADMGEDHLEQILQPIGLSKVRSTQLRAIAQVIKSADRSALASDEFMRSLPGIGRYISNCVLCFAFGMPKPALDSNMIRIIQRVFDYQSERKRPREDMKLWEFAGELVPKDAPSEYNWGILDFGAIVCTHHNTKCDGCLIRNMCVYYNKRFQVNATR